MNLGSIADAFKPPYGDLIKSIIGMMFFTPFVASVDFDWQPPA